MCLQLFPFHNNNWSTKIYYAYPFFGAELITSTASRKNDCWIRATTLQWNASLSSGFSCKTIKHKNMINENKESYTKIIQHLLLLLLAIFWALA